MIRIRKSNAQAALYVLVMLAVVFISFYAMMKPFALTYNKLDKQVLNVSGVIYTTQASCENSSRVVRRGYWYDDNCYDLHPRAANLLVRIRSFWLIAPIIFAIGLLIWLITVATRQDPQTFYR